MTLEQWIALQEKLASTVKDIPFTKKETRKIIRFFSSMIRDKAE